MAAWINVTIEQICGTCVEGCCKAMAGMLPHFMKTFVTPLVDKNLEKLCTSLLGK